MNRAAFALLALCSCTSIGPMPATTGISAAPIGRPGVEAQVGAAPGFYASQAATNNAEGKATNYGSVLLDPDRWLPIKGLLVGARLFGKDDDTPLEPYLGYRRRLVERVAFGVVGFGSTTRHEVYGASYHGVRLGGEAMADVELWVPNDMFRIRAQGALSVTRILASGRYCADDEGRATDCNEDTTLNNVISGKFVGVYPAGTAQVALDFGKHEGTLHAVRVALLATAGRMPLVLDGEENGTAMYYSFGISLSAAFGLGRAASE